MSDVSGPSVPAIEEQFDIFSILESLFAEWKLVLSFGAGVALLAGLYGLISTPQYRAEAIAAPLNTDLSSGGLSGSSSALGSLASLAGLDQGGGQTIEQNIAILGSRSMFDQFIKAEKLKPELFPSRWDAAQGRWKPPSTVGQTLISLGLREPPGPDGAPSDWAAYEAFKSHASIVMDKDTGLLTVDFSWKDPNVAADWANRLLADANDKIRDQVQHEAQDSMRILTERIPQTTSSETKDTLVQLMALQQRIILQAQVRRDFAFKIIDPAKPPMVRASPLYGVLLITGFFGGAVLGSVLALTRRHLATRRARRK